MHIHIGFDIALDFDQATPALLMLNVHPSRSQDLVLPDSLRFDPEVPVSTYIDAFGNLCSRVH